MQNVQIKSIDGINLSGLLWDRGGNKSVLLLHAMPETKESWEELAEELYSRGLNVLAIDFRGHGESEGVEYKKQKPEEIQNYFLDARAGLNYLEEKYQHTNFVLAGASIGANIALHCMAHDHAIKKAVVFSPGKEYYGVKADDFVKDLNPNQEVLFVSAKDDTRVENNSEMTEELYSKCKSKKQKKILEEGGHGTDIMGNNEDLFFEIIDFIAK